MRQKRKKAIVDKFEFVWWQFPGRFERNREKSSQVSSASAKRFEPNNLI